MDVIRYKYRNFLHSMNMENIDQFPFSREERIEPTTSTLANLVGSLSVWGIKDYSGLVGIRGYIYLNHELSINKDFKLLVATRPDNVVSHKTFSIKETPGLDGGMISSNKTHNTYNITLEFSVEFPSIEDVENNASRLLYEYFMYDNFVPLKFWYGNDIYMVKCNGNINFTHQRMMGKYIIGTVEFIVKPYKYISIGSYGEANLHHIVNYKEENIKIDYPGVLSRLTSRPVIYFKIQNNIVLTQPGGSGSTIITGSDKKAPNISFNINGRQFKITEVEVDRWYIFDSRIYQLYIINDGTPHGRNTKLVGYEFPELKNTTNNIFVSLEFDIDGVMTNLADHEGEIPQDSIDIIINPFWRSI